MEWSWPAWLVSVAAVVISGMVAWLEGNWRQRPGLAMGFANHAGMWDDLVLLPIANAAIVPYLTVGSWLTWAIAAAAMASIAVHMHWYQSRETAHTAEHMWPARRHDRWHRDLSAAGWLHVLYVIGELTLLAGFLLHPMPAAAVAIVAAAFTLHVPVGLLQPRWFVTRQIGSIRQQPLLVGCLLALWMAVATKL